MDGVTVTPDEMRNAPDTDAAAALLVADGVPADDAWEIAAIERGEHPGDLVDVDEWPEL